MTTQLLPIGAYIEALNNQQQRHPKLHRFCSSQPDNRHNYIIDKENITFHLTDTKQQSELSLPLSGQFPLTAREIRRREVLTSRHKLFAEATFIPGALMVFDAAAKAHLCDGLLQRSYTPLFDFIRQNCSISRRGTLRNAIESLSVAFETLNKAELHHGNLNAQRICFDSRGEVRLMDFPIAVCSKGDYERLAEAAILLYVGASEPSACKLIATTPLSVQGDQRRLRMILSTAEYHGVDALASLTKALLNEASPQSIGRAIKALSGTPFRPLPLLRQMLENRRESTIDFLPTLPELDEEESVMVDFKLCDEILPASDLIVRFRMGERWGYAHIDGCRINVQRTLRAARDFMEGRAVVATKRGYGLIDTTGRMVMNDVWEDLEWYGEENVAVAADNSGLWHIYDRMGRRLSAIGADWMGDATEGFIVARKGKKYGYYTTDGVKRSDFIYDEAFGFNSGYALVCHKGKYYHIDSSLHRASKEPEG